MLRQDQSGPDVASGEFRSRLGKHRRGTRGIAAISFRSLNDRGRRSIHRDGADVRLHGHGHGRGRGRGRGRDEWLQQARVAELALENS